VLLPSDTHKKPITSITAVTSICDLFTDSPCIYVGMYEYIYTVYACCFGRLDRSVDVEIALQNERSRNQGSIPGMGKRFSLLLIVQVGSSDYLMGKGGSFPGVELAGAQSRPLISV
jgi:hypothetical protein